MEEHDDPSDDEQCAYSSQSFGQNSALTFLDTDYEAETNNIKLLLEDIQKKYIGDWLGKEYQKNFHAEKARHRAVLNQLDEQREAAKSDLKNIEEKKGIFAKEKLHKSAEIEKMQLQLQKRQQELDGLLLVKEQAQKRLESITKDQQLKEKMLEENRSNANQVGEELEQSLDFFRKRLGLQLKKVSGERLQFVFTHIDDKDPTRPFCFCVKINEDRTFAVSNCEPLVDNFDELKELLNKTNNFRSFVIALRKTFKDMVS